jgi:hypothetical protein
VESKLLVSLGKVAGIGGIALGVLFLLFRQILQKQYLPQLGLNGAQSFHIIIAILVFTFGIAAIGILAWIIARGATGPVPNRTVLILTVFAVLVLFIAAKVGSNDDGDNNRATSTPSPTPIPATPTPPRKYFTEKLDVHERDADSSHGVNIKTQFIGIGPNGAWVQLEATTGESGNADTLTKGGVIKLYRPDCDSLTVTVKDIKLEKPQGVNWKDLEKMGPAAEGLITRTATLILSGKCEE